MRGLKGLPGFHVRSKREVCPCLWRCSTQWHSCARARGNVSSHQVSAPVGLAREWIGFPACGSKNALPPPHLKLVRVPWVGLDGWLGPHSHTDLGPTTAKVKYHYISLVALYCLLPKLSNQIHFSLLPSQQFLHFFSTPLERDALFIRFQVAFACLAARQTLWNSQPAGSLFELPA